MYIITKTTKSVKFKQVQSIKIIQNAEKRYRLQSGPVLGWGDRCGCTGPHSERAPYLRERGYYNCYKQVAQGPPVAHVKGDPPYNNFAQGPKYARAGPGYSGTST